MQLNELKTFVLHELEDMKATDVTVLDVRKLTSMTDLMFFCTGNSARHVKSIGRHLYDKARSVGLKPLGIEGESDAEWVLIDLGDALIHVMQAKSREFYQLEKLWGEREA